SKPCGTCGACREIAEGRFVDLIEIDAASRTKVEDMRELLENVQYAPTRGRFKVYLIDEVHMLSTSSFNALLKTLEEPPPHVKFLLATTDPQKLPVTVLSRCLQFNLKNMSPERIVGHLQRVLTEESLTFEEPALWLLARAADGSMRDALSLTDQAIAFGGNQLCTRDVSAMLGTVDQGQVVRLVEAIAHRDGVQLLELVAQFSEFSPNYAHALDSMASLLHRVAIEQAVPGAVDNSQGDQEELRQLARNLSAEDVQLFYQIAIQSRRDLSLAPDPRTGFEMALLRMLAFMPNATQQPQPVALASSSVQAEAPAQATGPDSIASQPAQAPQPVEQTSAPAVSQEPEQVSPPVAPVSVEPHQAASTPADQTTASLAASQEGLNPVPKPEPSPSRSPSEGSSPPVEESEEPAPEAALPASAQIPEVNKADDVTPVMASTPLMESAPVVENAPVPVVESAGAEDELTTSDAPVEMAVAQGESVVFNDGPP